MMRKIYFLLAMLIANIGYAYEIPDLGNADLNQKTQPAWLKLAAGFTREIRGAKERLHDPISENYLSGLVTHLNPRDANTKLFIINSQSINAFAGPGEVIVLHTGLFANMNDENELAAVLAHELSHQDQHHLWRKLQHEKDLQIPVAIGTMVAIAIGAWNPVLGQSALSAGATLLEDNELRYSRAFEQEADRMGIRLLVKSGFDPKSMAGFFAKLSDQERFTLQRQVPEILRTHPVTHFRIADATNHANELVKQHPASSLDFLLIKERLSIISTPFQQRAIEDYRKKDQLSTPENYGYALALYNTQKTDLALEKMSALHKQYAHNVIIGLTLASFYSGLRQDGLANNLLSDLYQHHPQQKTVSMAYAKTLFDQGCYDKVILVLNKMSITPEAHELLAAAFGKKHLLAQAYFHQARAMELLSEPAQAKIYYKKAQKETHDLTLIGEIEHRLRLG